MASQKVMECSKALVQKEWTVAFVESATAGKMSYEFSTVPDSGKILIGGMVCYDARMKEDVLDIPHALIEEFTPESAEVTRAMANNFSKMAPADVCVAVTGLTAPGGSESSEKPVGTIFLHLILPDGQIARRFEFKGSPQKIVDQAIDAAAVLILNVINQPEKKSSDLTRDLKN
jgi:nicotinamide-nucleotide amidase